MQKVVLSPRYERQPHAIQQKIDRFTDSLWLIHRNRRRSILPSSWMATADGRSNGAITER